MDSKDKNGWTALVWGAVKGQSEVAKILLDNGANVNSKDKKGFTALIVAVLAGQSEVAKILLDNGANPDLADSNGITAWDYAKNKPLIKQVLQDFLATKKQPEKQPKNAGKNERYYSDLWCESQGGKSQARLADNTLADCITDEYAVEFDFGKPHKSYECLGQAIHYAHITKLKPLCILIRSADISADDFAQAVSRITSPVEVQCMNVYGEIFPCPVAKE